MKQLLIILFAVLIMILAGCTSKTNNNESLVSDTTSVITSSQDNTETSQADKQNASSDSTSTERSEQDNDSLNSSTVSKSDLETETASTQEPSGVESTVESEPISSNDTESIIPNPDDIYPPKATAADTDFIAQKMVEYINEYRKNEGTPDAQVLLGLTEYAKYRSKQLVTNFAHDTIDERAAATALKYGQYIDTTLYGMQGEPYYTANAREAISKTDYGGSVEQVAKYIARNIYESKSHWSYVGSADYKYIAIGVTLDNNVWYCNVAMSRTNTYN